MNFFSRSKNPASGDLEDRVAKLESGHRRLQDDLDDLWDRFRRFTGRQAKRAAVDAAEAPQTPQSRREQLNQQILARRVRGSQPEH